MKIYADTGDIELALSVDDYVFGYTSNPSLMRSAGVTNYIDFVNNFCEKTSKPISFEVFSDDFEEMRRQALVLSSISDNIYVKIPVTNGEGESSNHLIRDLISQNIKVNVTAVFTKNQIDDLFDIFSGADLKSIISIFCGRIANTYRDPEDIMRYASTNKPSNCETLWASTREVYNILQAERCACDIITVPPSILNTYINDRDKDLSEFSLETVRMFNNDAASSKFFI